LTDFALPIYSSALVMAMVGSLFLAVVGFLRNRVPGAIAFLLGTLAAFFYALGSLFEIHSTTEAQVLTALTVEYVGIATIGPLWLLTATSATRGDLNIGRRNSVLLFLLPFVTLLLVATNPFHHLVFTSIQVTHRGPFTVPILDKGPFWPLNMIYMTGCLVWGIVSPLRASWRAPRAHQVPLVLLSVSGAIPVLGMVLYQFGLSPWGLDVAPFGITLAAVVLSVALFRFRLFDLPPLATDQVFANMREGVLVVDLQDRIIGTNPALARVLDKTRDALVGQNLATLGLPELRSRLDLTLTHGTVRQIFQVDRSPLVDRKNRLQGEIFMLTDITQREELAERVARMARIDELTDLPNRRGFLERLAAEADRFRRYGRTPSLAIADIDHFKSINDTWGHEAGDAALVHVAQVWSAGLRASDILARYGGEEFVFLMAETPADEARILLERLRIRLESQPLIWRNETIWMTASFGFATGDPDLCPDAVDALMSAADRALYLAKESGRNQVRGEGSVQGDDPAI